MLYIVIYVLKKVMNKIKYVMICIYFILVDLFIFISKNWDVNV